MGCPRKDRPPVESRFCLTYPAMKQSSLHFITQTTLLASGAKSFAMQTLADQVTAYMRWRSETDGKEFSPSALAEAVARHQTELPAEKRCKRQNIEQLLGRGLRTTQYLVALAKAMGTTAEVLQAGRFVPGHADGLEGDDFVSFTRLDDSPAPSMQPILAWNHEDDLPPGEFVMIPRMAVNLSCGNGHEQTEIEFVKKQPQAFRADWIRQKHLKPAKLAAMSASGNSMEPRIWDGDSLVVDTSQTRVVDGKVYALWYDGGERVKRLFGMPGGGLRISSDNPAFETIEVSADELEHVRILGRVVHIAGDGGL